MISLWKYGLWIQNSIVFSLWRSWALSLFFTLLYVIWCLNWCIVWKGSSGLWLFMVMHWISIGNNKCHVPDIKKFQILCSTILQSKHPSKSGKVLIYWLWISRKALSACNSNKKCGYSHAVRVNTLENHSGASIRFFK